MGYLYAINLIEDKTLGIIKNKYFHSLIVLLLFFVSAKIIVHLSERWILRLTKKTKTELDDLIVKKSNRPVSFLIFLLGVRFALIPLDLSDGVKKISNDVVSTLIIGVLVYLVIVIIDIIVDSWAKNFAAKTKSRFDDNLVSLAHKFTRVTVILVGLLFILNTWGIQVGPFLASLGIAGIAVALGLQNTLGNIFGGISLIVDRSIRVGDIIKIDEDTSGTVIDVGLRSTKIRTWDNEVIVIPNGKLAGEKIKNYVLPTPMARVVVPFSVAYGTDIDKVKKIVMKEIKKLDNLDENHKPMVMFMEMGESSLNFKAFVYLKSYKDRFHTKEKLNCMIYNALNRNKISIPFPQMDVYIKEYKKGK